MKYFIPTPKRIPFTKEGYEKLLTDKQKYTKERPEAVEHLRKAREMGDLSENGYYKASRARLSFIDAQLRKLERQIRLAKIVEANSSGVIGFGSTVTISLGSATQTWTVVGSFESDPATHTISHISPLGKSLLGKKTGDIVEFSTPKGMQKVTIVSVT